MNTEKVFVTIIGLLLIALIYWFFLAKKERSVKVKDSVDIIVNGGYNPEVISIKKDRAVKINFLRQDPSSCLEEVVISDFNIRRYLPINEKVTINLLPSKSGDFNYSCGMNMYHGTIRVED